MGILAFVLIVITNLLITTSSFSQEEIARIEVQRNARFALEKIVRDIQIQNTITIPDDTNPISNLILDDISYSVDQNRLKRTDPTSAELVTNNQVKVDSITFSKVINPVSNPSLKITIVINYTGQVEGNKNLAQSFTTSYTLK